MPLSVCLSLIVCICANLSDRQLFAGLSIMDCPPQAKQMPWRDWVISCYLVLYGRRLSWRPRENRKLTSGSQSKGHGSVYSRDCNGLLLRLDKRVFEVLVRQLGSVSAEHAWVNPHTILLRNKA